MNQQFNDSRDDEISRLFRENQKKLEEMPSRQVWSRLENRLDNRRLYRRRVIYRYSTMAAAIVAILAIVTAIIVFEKSVDTLESAPIAENKMSTDEKLIAEAKERHRLEQAYEEAELEKAVNQKIEEEIALIEKKEKRPVERPKLIPRVVKKKVKELPKETLNFNNAPVVSNDVTTKPKVAPPPPPPKPVVSEVFEIAEVEAMPESEFEKELAEEDIEIPKPAAYKARTYDEEVVSKRNNGGIFAKKDRKDKSAKKKNIKEAEYAPAKAEKIAPNDEVIKFHWLVGNWEDSDTKKSYEQWALSGKVLFGRGYYVHKDDTTFMEQMQLRMIGESVYFITTLEDPQTPFYYKLVSSSSKEWIFENTEIEFPNQFIIKRGDGNTFSATFQNKEPANIKPEQAEYLNYRNRITREQAVRNLSRTSNE